jgi:anion-transporting  ArsA/GET3 family ATPase
VSLFDRRLLVITGKGGVGRSTVSAALALAAGRTGRRVCVVELSGLAAVPPLFGLAGRSYEPRTVGRIDLRGLTAPEAVADFGRRKMALGGLFGLIFGSRATRSFLDAVPGFQDLVQLGKIENMISEPGDGEPRYDLVILDGPATGHGLTLLASARAMSEMTGVGPFHELASIIGRFLSDPVRTGVLPVTLPEELPVHETLDLVAGLGEEIGTLAGTIVNQWVDPGFPADGGEQVQAALAERAPDWAALVRTTREVMRAQLEVGEHLRSSLQALAGAVAVHQLPRLDPHDPRRLVARLAEHLEAA